MLKKLLLLLSILLVFTAITFPIFADVSTTATVPPKTDSFQFEFTSNDSGDRFSTGKVLSYTITYGALSSAAFATQTTITVEFSHDVIQGTHVLDYAFGSASDAYNNIHPIVDLNARTITWIIPSLPPGVTDQKLTFAMRINGNYTSTVSEGFSVKALMSNQFVSFPEQNIYQTLDNTITPTPQPLSTPTPTPLPTSPQSPQNSSGISDVFFNTVTNTQGEISVLPSSPSKISISYGTSPNALTQTIATGDYSSFTKVVLTDLKPSTVYYARITTIDENGHIARSEIFTFKTAAVPPSVAVDKGTVVLTSDGNVLGSTLLQGNNNTQTVLPNTAPYEITYSIPASTKVKDLDVVVRNKYVLGINTFVHAQESNIILLQMIEKQPGVYFAQLPPLPLSGDYEVYVRVTETTGNIYEQKVSEIKISLPLQILEKGTNQPLADARAYFYFYNNQTKQFEPIAQSFGNVKNPDFSDKQGFVHVTLPKGRYKVDVSTLFHDTVTKEFTLDANTSYPTIYLANHPGNLLGFVQYFGNTIFDFFSNIATYVHGLSVSTRYFNVLAVIILVTSILLSFLLFSFRSLIPLTRLPFFLYHHLHHAVLPFRQEIMYGKVISPTGTPLPETNVYIVDNNEKVLFHTTTNRHGIFIYKKPQGVYIHLHMIHDGYEELHIPVSEGNNGIYVLVENPDITHELRKGVVRSFQTLLGFSFEAVLGLSVLLEIAFLTQFGLLKTIPFFVLSLANVILWIFYTKRTVRTHLERRIGVR